MSFAYAAPVPPIIHPYWWHTRFYPTCCPASKERKLITKKISDGITEVAKAIESDFPDLSVKLINLITSYQGSEGGADTRTVQVQMQDLIARIVEGLHNLHVDVKQAEKLATETEQKSQEAIEALMSTVDGQAERIRQQAERAEAARMQDKGEWELERRALQEQIAVLQEANRQWAGTGGGTVPVTIDPRP